MVFNVLRRAKRAAGTMLVLKKADMPTMLVFGKDWYSTMLVFKKKAGITEMLVF